MATTPTRSGAASSLAGHDQAREAPRPGWARDAQGDDAVRGAPLAVDPVHAARPREVKVSPRWVPIVMFGLLGIGLVVIFLNYLGVLPGGMSNAYLGLGLAAICGGIVTATQYR